MAKTYDEQAEHFAKFAPSSFTFVHVERPAYDAYLPKGPDRKVLDIGSGAGRMAGYLISRSVKPQDITGVEISPNLVEIAKRDNPGVNFVCGDARSPIEIEPGTLDLVTSHMVLEFLDPQGLQAVLQTAYRLLKSGGVFCAITTHPHKMEVSDGVTESGWFETSAPWGSDDTIQNWFRTKDEFRYAVRKSGLELLVMKDLRVPVTAEQDNIERYAHYLALDPIRLIIKATKG